MKRFLTVFALAALTLAACQKYDDSDLQNKYTSLESKFTILEKSVDNLKSTFNEVQELVAKGSVITSVDPLEHGYRIGLSNGDFFDIYNGEDGEPGTEALSSVTVGETSVTFTVADGSTFEFPLYKGFALSFESDEVEIEAGSSASIPYTVTGGTEATTVGVINAGGLNVWFEDGNLYIETPEDFSETSVVVYADNGAGSSSIRTVKVTTKVVEKPVFKDTFDWSTASTNAVGSTSNEYGWATLTTNGTGGWTSEKVNSHDNIWGRAGHVRLSRSNEGGILISPALSSLAEATDLVVTFSAARWYNKTSDATDAHNFFTVYTSDGSKVCATADGTYSDKLTIEITNKYDVVEWQAAEGATYTFYVKGATAATKLVWSSTDAAGSTTFTGTARLVLDNVEVNKLAQ